MSAAVLLAVLSATPRACAQALEVHPMQPGPGMALTHVNVGPRSFAVFFGRGAHPIADCERECEFWAWPGKYRVLVRNGEGPHDNASVPLRIRRSGSYAFVPAHGGAQNAGLILGVAGPVIGFVGAVFTAAGGFATCSAPPPGEGCDKPTAFYIGLGALAVGSAMTAIGWPLYIHNRAHFLVRDAPTPRPVVRWGVAPMPHGGLGLGAAFAF
ncbi:MAG: hypothetical protein ABIQ16_12010 [Polyangiaceae bacterium]